MDIDAARGVAVWRFVLVPSIDQGKRVVGLQMIVSFLLWCRRYGGIVVVLCLLGGTETKILVER